MFAARNGYRKDIIFLLLRLPVRGKPLSAKSMRSNRINTSDSRKAGKRTRDGFILALPVHFDAIRMAPRAWITALWWRVLGKRVRAHGQFAPLLAASPRAYRLWLQTEPTLPKSEKGNSLNVDPIIAIVGAGAGQAETLRSLDEQGAQVMLLGTVQTPDLTAVVAAVDWSARPWLLPLAAGDTLAPGALDAYRAAIADTNERIVYADDDLIDASCRRTKPHFKPLWNSELLRHFDYLTWSCILRADAEDLADLDGHGRDSLDWAQRLTGRILARSVGAKRIAHVLHHRRSRPQPQVPTAFHSEKMELPRVTVIVPTRNRIDLLRTCIEGLGRTDYPDFEVIVVDNGSDDPATLDYLAKLDPMRYRILRDDGPFNFSRLNNEAAKLATGELLCLLNNDIEMLSGDWLAIMARQAMRPEVGAVGAQLLYPDGRIQHAGVVLGICGGAAHAHRLLDPEEEGYFRRHALPQFTSAVTAACLVVKRKSFEAVGGLDETKFAVAFNDVDLCLRLNAAGWQSFYEPRAMLVHHESVSRGLDRDPVGAARLAGELAALRARWHTDTDVDPYHHPQLNRYSERFVVQL